MNTHTQSGRRRQMQGWRDVEKRPWKDLRTLPGTMAFLNLPSQMNMECCQWSHVKVLCLEPEFFLFHLIRIEDPIFSAIFNIGS